MFQQIWTVDSVALCKYLDEVIPEFKNHSNHYHPGGMDSGGQNTYHSTYDLPHMLSDDYADQPDDEYYVGPTQALEQIETWLDAMRRDAAPGEYVEVRDFQPDLDTLFWWLVKYKGLVLPSTDITVLLWW